jgi:hypothetical protein
MIAELGHENATTTLCMEVPGFPFLAKPGWEWETSIGSHLPLYFQPLARNDGKRPLLSWQDRPGCALRFSAQQVDHETEHED